MNGVGRFCLASFLLFLPSSVMAQLDVSGVPILYEVLINGESFRVEGNRVVKLESKTKPGTTYQVAIRASRTQPLRLNSVELEYELPARVFDNRHRDPRVVRIRHELGFSVLITDFGSALEEKEKAEVLNTVKDALVEDCKSKNASEVEAKKLEPFQFKGSVGQGYRIHYLDDKQNGNTALVYLLNGGKFAVTVVAQFLDTDLEEVQPMFRRMLDSVRAIP